LAVSWNPTRAPQGAGVQRRPQRPRPEPPGRRGHLDGALDQPAVQVRLDQPGPEPHQRALGKRWPLGVQAVQHQLPAPIHHRRLDHLVVADPLIGLHDQRQRQLRGRHGRLPVRRIDVRAGQLGLERLVEQLMAMLAQEHEQLGPPDSPDDRLLRS
jgi:hypothetical protein